MKKRISFRLFCTVVWRGICQAAGRIGRFFGYRDGSGFGKVVWRIFAGSAALVVLYIAVCLIYLFGRNVIYDRWIGPMTDTRYWEERHISYDIVYQWQYRHKARRLYNEATGEVLMRNIEWVAVSDDKDSLAVFAKGGKRGYLNRFTGEVVIPADKYTRAWVFSEGLAAVEKDGRLLFIDHSGNEVIDKGFSIYFNNPGYAFHNGYCILHEPVCGKVGLIDREGSWALEPEYDNIFNSEGFWQVEKDGLEGLFTSDLDTMFAVSQKSINIYMDMIEVGYADHTSRLYDFDGNIIVDFRIDRVENLLYQTEDFRICPEGEDEGTVYDPGYAVADCMKYTVYEDGCTEYCGLMDRRGRRITPPDYISIEAIARDRYLCRPHGVILDDRGMRVD